VGRQGGVGGLVVGRRERSGRVSCGETGVPMAVVGLVGSGIKLNKRISCDAGIVYFGFCL